MATGLIGSAVDETPAEAYPVNSMKTLIYRYLALAAVLSGTGFPVAAEDLDAALAAQKKKAQRQIYSESALLDERNLTVPRTKSEEEKLLDKKLQEMDARAATEVSSQNPATPRPAQMPAQPVDAKNWLTPAMLDEAAAMSTPDSKEDSWLAKEKERQKELKDQEAARKENELVDKLLREQPQPLHTTSEMERLKKYQIGPKNFTDDKNSGPAGSSYKLPQTQRIDPLAATRLMPKKETPAVPAVFSPEAARISSALDKDPLRSTRIPAVNPPTGIPSRQSSTGFSSGLDADTTPLTPLQMLRKSSPINKQNPFAEDHMPQIKGSIWE